MEGTPLGTYATKIFTKQKTKWVSVFSAHKIKALKPKLGEDENVPQSKLACGVLVAQSCPTLCDSMDYGPPGSSVHGDSPGKNTGVGCHFLLQGIFLTQGSNPDLLHCRQILYHVSP